MEKRIEILRPGGHHELRVVEFSAAPPMPDEVRVDVIACGVNYADCLVRMGLYQSAKDFVGWPITPGFEFSGYVQAVGEGVTHLRPGDPVFGVTRFGAYASSVVVPKHQVFLAPSGIELAALAGFPAVFLTAYYPLFELSNLRGGDSLLVHSAAGGVGSAFIQLAKAHDCYVVGVVSESHKIETAREQGADEVICKSRAEWASAARALRPEGYNYVCDANGPSTLKQSFALVASAGKLVVYGFHSMLERGAQKPSYLKLALQYFRTPRFNPLDLTTQNKSILAYNLSYLFHRTDFLQVAIHKLIQLLQQQKISLPPTQFVPFERVADAHTALESGSSVGKLVLKV